MKMMTVELPNCLRIWPLEQTDEWFWIKNEGSSGLCKHLLAGNMRSRVTDSAKSDRDHRADPETQTHAGSFLYSDTVSNVNHEALDDPWVLGQLLTFGAAQNVPLTFMGLSLHTYRFLLLLFFYFLSHLRVTKSSHVQAAGIFVLLTEFPESTSTGLMLHFCSCAQVLLPSLATVQYPCQSKKFNTVFGCILFLPGYDVLNVDSITLQNSVWSR